MPWGLYGYGAPQAPTGIADLYSPRPRFSMPPEPTQIGGIGDLSEEERRRYRMGLMGLIGSAFGQASTNGQLGTALSHASLDSGDMQAQMIEAARRRQREEYTLSRQRAQEDYESRVSQWEDEKERRTFETLREQADRIAQREPDLADNARFAFTQQDARGIAGLMQTLDEREERRRAGIPTDTVGYEEWKRKQEQAEYDRRQKLQTDENIRQSNATRGIGGMYGGVGKLPTGYTWGTDPDGQPTAVRVPGLDQPKIKYETIDRGAMPPLHVISKYDADGVRIGPPMPDPAYDPKTGQLKAPTADTAGMPIVSMTAIDQRLKLKVPTPSVISSPHGLPAGAGQVPQPAPPKVERNPFAPPPPNADAETKLKDVRSRVGGMSPDQEKIARSLLAGGMSIEDVIRQFNEARNGG